MNSLLLWIGGLLVAVLGLMFAAPYVIDWNAYRGVFEEEASRVLGREVRVGGAVNLRLLPSPYVRFEKVRISDQGAALGEPFFRAEAFTLWLSPTPLLRGAIEASEVEFDRPVLRLAIDAEGRGNWQAIRVAAGSVPFIPSDVILQQVRIRGGIVSLKTPGQPEPLTLSGIEGEVSAASIDGPYRFRGMIDWYGTRRELRIGTSQREADGRLRYKATVRSPENGNVYAVDGALTELSAKARHTGALTAKLPLAGFFGTIMAEENRARSARAGETIELKANLDGDLDGARLTDLTFSFEVDGKPQSLNGQLTATWRNGLRVETQLDSRWMDLDPVIGPSGGKASPIETFRRLVGGAGSMLPSDGTALLMIGIDQVNLGGDTLAGVRLAIARAGGLTSIGELRAALPGSAYGELRGSIGATAGRDPAGAFDGQLVLRGGSHRRLAAWIGVAGLLPGGDLAAALDGPFALDTRLRLQGDAVALSDTRIELGSRRVSGSADWSWGSQPRLDITAEGHSIDIAAFAPGALDLVGSRPNGAQSGETDGRRPGADSGSAVLAGLSERAAAIGRGVGSLRLRLRAGELVDGRTKLRDVETDIAIRSDAVSISALRLISESGARIDLQGDLGTLQTRPSGSLRGWLAAEGAGGVGTMLRLLPTGAQGLVGPWLSSSARSDLGFTLKLGSAGPDARQDHVALEVDGMLDGSRGRFTLELGGGLGRWREAPVALSLDLAGASAEGILRRMIGRGLRPGAAAGAAALEHVAFHLAASGPNSNALVATARLDAIGSGGTSTVAYTGRAAVGADDAVELGGEIALSTPAVADLLVLTGGGRRVLLPSIAARGNVGVERKGGTTTLKGRGLEIGSTRVSGNVLISQRGERTRLDGQLSADRIALVGLLGLVLDGQAGAATQEAAAATAPDASPWPEASFSLGLLDGLEGLLTVATPVAGLTPELELSEAEVQLAFGTDRLEIRSLTGAALGGRFTARGAIEAIQAGAGQGAGVTLDVSLTGAQIARLTAIAPAGQGRAGMPLANSGEFNARLAMTARAMSPQAAMATATGRGEIEIRNGRAQGIAATLVENAAIAALESSDTVDRAALERILRAERSRSQVALGNRKLPVEIVDGTARIGALDIAAPEAGLRNVTTVDLVRLAVDSAWQITPRRAPPSSGRAGGRSEPLPQMSFVWTGRLGAIARSEPRVSVEQLERELSIRRMERDAEKLEELRRQDEERMRRLESPDREQPSAAPTAAPVIEVPLPINPQRGNSQPSAAERPEQRGIDAPPQPRIIRPPPPRARGDARTIQDVFTQQ